MVLYVQLKNGELIKDCAASEEIALMLMLHFDAFGGGIESAQVVSANGR